MYTIKKCTLENMTKEDCYFIVHAASELTTRTGSKYKWQNFKIARFVEREHLWICYRSEHIVGFLMASQFKSFFDSETILLKQNLLFALPHTKATYLLLKEFIDFGKAHANHVLTAIGRETNIKPSSLKRLGFSKLEELYRMEISR